MSMLWFARERARLSLRAAVVVSVCAAVTTGWTPTALAVPQRIEDVRSRRKAGPVVLQKGRMVPDFAFRSIDRQGTVTRRSLAGKVFLVDFWAVWCAPCVAEMKYLHAAMERFKGQGFTIVSVSLDKSVADVARFRSGKWRMPWFNAYLAGQGPLSAFDTESARAFGLVSLPRAVLVGRDGRIIALDAEVRGARLEETLARVFLDELGH